MGYICHLSHMILDLNTLSRKNKFTLKNGTSVAPQCQKCIGKKDNRKGYIFHRIGRRG